MELYRSRVTRVDFCCFHRNSGIILLVSGLVDLLLFARQICLFCFVLFLFQFDDYVWLF